LGTANQSTPNKLYLVANIPCVMVKRRCNFQDRERKALFGLYELVKALDQKVDYVIESQREHYYSQAACPLDNYQR